MTPELERDRGARALRILEDDIFKDACDKLRASILKAWEHSRPDDSVARERAYSELRLLNGLLKDIETVMQTGELAGRQIELRQRK